MNIFARLLLKKSENPKDDKTREAVGKRAGVLCIILNTILAGAKIALGAISGAVSVLADGFNNLTDCGSNIVSVIGFKMSGKPADKEHPFGHQRAETVSALLIAVIILVVAVELATSSVQKIVAPEASAFSIWLIVILSASALLKLFMFAFNRALAKATESETLSATAVDSVSDSIATLAVLVALIISHYTGVILDGYAGVGVALFIAFSGFNLLRETISKLLGRAPDKQVVKLICDRIMAFDRVLGIHDLAVHSYGQNKMYATVHVEVDSAMLIMHAHELADDIEKDFIDNTDIILTVHIDPLVIDNPTINGLKTRLDQTLLEIDGSFKAHDFRVVGGETRSNLVFDIAVPFESQLTDERIENLVKEKINAWGENLGVIVTVERQNLE